MNPIKLPMLLLSFSLVACVTTHDVSKLEPSLEGRPDCVVKKDNKVEIDVSARSYGVRPANLCVDRQKNSRIMFKIKGNPSGATVTVREKSGEPANWLRGSGHGQGVFFVDVPAGADARIYAYEIEVPGFGLLDPMISIER